MLLVRNFGSFSALALVNLMMECETSPHRLEIAPRPRMRLHANGCVRIVHRGKGGLAPAHVGRTRTSTRTGADASCAQTGPQRIEGRRGSIHARRAIRGLSTTPAQAAWRAIPASMQTPPLRNVLSAPSPPTATRVVWQTAPHVWTASRRSILALRVSTSVCAWRGPTCRRGLSRVRPALTA